MARVGEEEKRVQRGSQVVGLAGNIARCPRNIENIPRKVQSYRTGYQVPIDRAIQWHSRRYNGDRMCLFGTEVT